MDSVQWWDESDLATISEKCPDTAVDVIAITHWNNVGDTQYYVVTNPMTKGLVGYTAFEGPRSRETIMNKIGGGGSCVGLHSCTIVNGNVNLRGLWDDRIYQEIQDWASEN